MNRSVFLPLALLSLVSLAGCTATPLPPTPPVAVSPANASPSQWRTTERVVVITDASGTMYAAETFPEAKALTQSFIASMPDPGHPAADPRYEAGVVGFGGDDCVVAPVAAFDRATLSSTADQIEVMGAIDRRGGETPIYRVLAELQNSVAADQRRTAIVLFSDGGADFPEVSLANARALTEANPQLCFHSVQVGADPEGKMFLESLAGLSTCGSYRTATTLGDAAAIAAFSTAVFMENAPPPPVAASPAPRGADPCAVRVAFGGVNFEFNKAAIRTDAKPVLDKWSDRLAECPTVNLKIEGHTDSVGAEAYNDGLSERRAQAVRDYLVGRRIDAGRLNPVGRGETRPVATSNTAEGRAENRRVEIIAQ